MALTRPLLESMVPQGARHEGTRHGTRMTDIVSSAILILLLYCLKHDLRLKATGRLSVSLAWLSLSLRIAQSGSFSLHTLASKCCTHILADLGIES